MKEIVLKDEIGKKISVIRRAQNSLFPDSIFVYIIEAGSQHAYLEEDEVKLILKGINILRRE